MPKTSAEERKLRVKQLAALIAQGVSPEVACDELGEKYGLKTKSATRAYLDSVYQRWARDSKLSREASLSTAVAMRMKVIQSAFSRQKHIPMDEPLDPSNPDGPSRRVIRSVPDPDLTTALSAMDSLARIQGLIQPAQIEVLNEVVGPMMGAFISIVKRHVTDRAALEGVARDMREVLERGSATIAIPADAIVREPSGSGA